MINNNEIFPINKITIPIFIISGFILGLGSGYLTDKVILHEMTFNENYESIADPNTTINKPELKKDQGFDHANQ